MNPEDTERDKLWLRAIIATLSVEDVQKVTAEFNRIRWAETTWDSLGAGFVEIEPDHSEGE